MLFDTPHKYQVCLGVQLTTAEQILTRNTVSECFFNWMLRLGEQEHNIHSRFPAQGRIFSTRGKWLFGLQKDHSTSSGRKWPWSKPCVSTENKSAQQPGNGPANLSQCQATLFRPVPGTNKSTTRHMKALLSDFVQGLNQWKAFLIITVPLYWLSLASKSSKAWREACLPCPFESFVISRFT